MKKLRVMALTAVIFMVGMNSCYAQAALTIYNQDFAVVKDTVKLDLKNGTNDVKFLGVTAHLEPDSVILRDPAGKHVFQIMEQNYRADPVSQDLLLSIYEGKTIDFLIQRQDKTEIIQGKIIRSSYVPHWTAMRRYGQDYHMRQMAYVGAPGNQPIIEVDGKLRFNLPGIPLFPALADDTILKPTLEWLINTKRASSFDAELSYVTGGLNWESSYNMVAPEKGDVIDLIGWVTIDNQSGKAFNNAKIKLMAGDVQKIIPGEPGYDYEASYRVLSRLEESSGIPVTEKTFDEYHLYTLNNATTLHDRETKQVEFINASGIKTQTVYVYDGLKINRNRYRGWDAYSIRENREYGTESNTKVWVMREIVNSKANHLGIPLPKGKVRFYRRDSDGQVEFTGEDLIDHTPTEETVRFFTGNAFDLTGERTRTNYVIHSNENWLDESFEIKLRNHKKEPVEIRVVEHLYRWNTWEIKQQSQDFVKKNSNTIEFNVKVPPEKEQTITYTVHYTW
ncbi:MAG: hypothetical protein PHR22_04255 [Candidatus Omnitrophica bacterium]|nr:hypothetical protein [Candidatus Omnitrophota bacterium]